MISDTLIRYIINIIKKMFLDQKLADSPSNSVIKEYIGFSYASSNHISVATSGIRLKSGFYQ